MDIADVLKTVAISELGEYTSSGESSTSDYFLTTILSEETEKLITERTLLKYLSKRIFFFMCGYDTENMVTLEPATYLASKQNWDILTFNKQLENDPYNVGNWISKELLPEFQYYYFEATSDDNRIPTILINYDSSKNTEGTDLLKRSYHHEQNSSDSVKLPKGLYLDPCGFENDKFKNKNYFRICISNYGDGSTMPKVWNGSREETSSLCDIDATIENLKKRIDDIDVSNVGKTKFQGMVMITTSDKTGAELLNNYYKKDASDSNWEFDDHIAHRRFIYCGPGSIRTWPDIPQDAERVYIKDVPYHEHGTCKDELVLGMPETIYNSAISEGTYVGKGNLLAIVESTGNLVPTKQELASDEEGSDDVTSFQRIPSTRTGMHTGSTKYQHGAQTPHENLPPYYNARIIVVKDTSVNSTTI